MPRPLRRQTAEPDQATPTVQAVHPGGSVWTIGGHGSIYVPAGCTVSFALDGAGYAAGGGGGGGGGFSAPDPVLQEELRRQLAVQQAAWVERAEAQQAEAGERRKLGEARLLEWLSLEQARTYRERHYFDVTGSDGGQWRINTNSQTGNIVQLRPAAGSPPIVYCAHPYGAADPEAWLAQALAIMTDVPGFLAVANCYGPCYNPPFAVNWTA